MHGNHLLGIGQTERGDIVVFRLATVAAHTRAADLDAGSASGDQRSWVVCSG